MNMEELRIRLENSIQAEEIVLQGAVLTRLERACRKATRDAFVLVLAMVEEPGQLLGYADDGSEVRTVEKPPLGPRPDFGPYPLAQCSHCQDDPPMNHTCPACGRTKG